MMEARRRIPVLVVLPPRVLLLDLAGPLEVLRVAGAVQDRIAFDVSYKAPEATTRCSIGLALSGADPLPATIEDGAVVLVPGSSGRILGAPQSPECEARAEAEIIAWLRTAVRPGHTLVTVCDGALLAARAGLLDGYICTTHHESCVPRVGLGRADGGSRCSPHSRDLHAPQRERPAAFALAGRA